MTTHLLLIDCPDAIGLVYTIKGVLYHHGFNIVSNHEFGDPTTQHFFMRTEFAGMAEPDRVVDDLRQRFPPTATVRLAPTGKRPIVVLATKEAHCLGDLLLICRA